MPDKPKRRKNNKNKRKNKGQYQQNNNTSNATEKSKQTSVEQGDMKAYDESTVQHGEFVDEVTKESSTAAEGTSNEQIINDSITETDELASNIGTKENEKKDLLDKYKVESPEKPIKNKRKLRTEFKSKSLDNDNQPIIVEILDDIDEHEPKNELFQVNTSNILISECEPDIEWEKTDELKELLHDEHPVPGALSITTIPLNIAECEEIKSMSPEEEKSLRQYLKSLNLSTNIMDSDSLEAKTELDQIIKQEIKQRAKKGSAEVSFIPRPGPSRSLHVIDEEVSGESSAASCRHSYLSDKKSDNEELEDDVFYPAKDVKLKMCPSNKQKSCGNLIPQECIRVDAQIKDPGITEAKGTWTTTTLEKMTGAEIVYLTDSSSSTSSIYDNNDTEENNEESDVSVRIITPTIEVVDTDNFLKNNFISVPIKSKSDNKFRDIEELECNKKSINTLYHEKDQLEIDDDNSCKENHEIVVLSTDNINTDLYVKEIDTLCIGNHSIPSINEKEESQNKTSEPKVVDNYDLEIKVLKCELNVAINNLINEVVSDSDTTQDIQNDSFVRQDSSSSVDSSQCTAKYNPKFSSLNDVSSTEFDDIDKNSDRKLLDVNNSHVKDVIENIEDSNLYRGIKTNFVQSLRDICLETIYKLPYGEQILEELASVSERLQKINDQTGSLMSLSKHTTNNLDKNKVQNPVKTNTFDKKNMIPPPLQPRQSSLKIICDDTVNVIPTKSETKRYCLSPSQKMLIDKLNTSIVTKTTDSLEENKKCADKNSTPEDSTFGIPFKSQTGSRLLALLRNPSLAVNSREQRISEDNKKLGYSKNIPPFYKTCTKNEQNNITSISEDLSIKQNEERYSSKYFKPKPIPPPKPKTFSSSYYESDESSDFVENSFKSTKNHKQYFHFSTGNLNQEIEDDISCIQNMHRHFNDVYKEVRQGMYPRRPSLPKDLTDRQMEYICQKEKEVEAEIYRLETEQIRTSAKRGPRAPMLVDKESPNSSLTSFNRIRSSQSHGVLPSLINPDPGKLSSVFSKSQEELLRNKMYSEYVSQMAEREERKQKKIIKITKTPGSLKNNTYSKSSSELNIFDSQSNNRIEKEFIDKAKERWSKLGIKDPETEDESAKNYYREPKVVEHKIKVIDSGEEKDVQKLPNHLQDFVMFTAKDKSDKMDTPGESEQNETSHGVILCAVIILILTITNYVVRLFRRQ